MGHILKPRLGLRLNHRHPLAQGLVGCWLMNEGSGGKVHSLVGDDSFFGTFEGNTTWGISPFGSCVSFDGSLDTIRLKIWDNTAGIVSLVASFKSTKAIGSNEQITSADSSSDYKRTFQFRRNSSGKLNFILFAGGVVKDIVGGTILTSNEWWHVAAVNDGVNASVYVNGHLDTSADNPKASGIMDNDAAAWGVGGRYAHADWSSITEPLQGSVGHLFCYNRALTASEIAQLHAEPYAMFEPDTGIWLRYYEAGGGAIIKVVNETLQFSESVNKAMVAKKIINETLQLSESTSKLQDTKKVVNETLQISESVEKKGVTKKVVNEVLQLSENVFKKGSIKKVINETLQFSEALLKRGSIKKIVNEVLQLSENVLKKGSIKKVVNETLQLAENIVRKSGIIRIINEVLNISEGIVKALAVALGWREVIEGDSPITLVVTGNSTITTEITGNSPLN